MSKERKQINVFQAFVSFPKTRGKIKENKCFLQEIVSLVEKNKDNLPAEIVIKKDNYRLILDSDDYIITIFFKKSLELRILMNKPEANIATVNKLANTILNYVNTVLKEKVVSSSIAITRIYSYEKTVNLPSKIIGSAQLAKANEVAKENLKPVAIAFEYTKDNKSYLISSMSTKPDRLAENAISIQFKLEEPIPFDLLQKQYENLKDTEQLLVKLMEGEL
jgi:hypothetical protein